MSTDWYCGFELGGSPVEDPRIEAWRTDLTLTAGSCSDARPNSHHLHW